ncbi:MAG: hypothetical protein AAF501_05640 [Pseudomonadota bacterium]
MTGTDATPGTVTDDEIVAFLDGRMDHDRQAGIAMAAANDPSLAQRIEAMSLDLAPLRAGMDALLDLAPDLAPDLAVPAGAAARTTGAGWSLRALAAAAVIAFAVGICAGVGALRFNSASDWHQAVAEYQVLYTTETLTASPLPDSLRANGLRHVSRRLGLELTEDALSIAGLGFQRAQMLEFEGAPLAQIVLLDDAGTPIAFCLMKATGGPAALADVTIKGMSATTWSDGRFSYIVIGPADQPAIRKAAEEISTRLPV